MLPPVLNNPYVRNQMMTLLTSKAPGNVMPILPIEGAVTGGRSFWAWKRTGFLEFQERFLEEVVVAGVWLFGFKAMNRFMDGRIEKLQAGGKLKGVYVEADWSKKFMQLFRGSKGNKPSILLSPLETFTHNHKNLLNTLSVKGFKWGVSVAVPLALVGFIIPKLNQIKTDWILKTFYAGKHPEPKQALGGHHKPYFAGSAANSVAAPVAHPINAFAAAPMAMTAAGFTGIAANPAAPAFSAGMHSGVNPAAVKPRFGFMGTKAASLLSSAAHLVENTTYGSVLFIDAGLTGGRMATAWPRSKFEAFEYGARDMASLYFYMFSVPHVMNAFEKLAEQKGTWLNDNLKRYTGKNFGTMVNFDQQVVERFNKALVSAMGNGAVNSDTLRAALNGLELKNIDTIRYAVQRNMRELPVADYITHLEKELHAYGAKADAKRAGEILDTVKSYLGKTKKIHEGKFSADSLEALLQHVWNDTHVLKGLTDAEKFHLNTAAKLAFHHNTGLSGEAFEKAALKAAGVLSKADEAQLVANIRQASKLGGDRVLASILRRSVNMAHLTEQHEIRKSLETVTRLAERAVLEARPVESFVADQLQHVLSEFQAYKGPKPVSPALQKAMNQLELVVSGKFNAKSPDALKNVLSTCADALKTHGSVFPKWMQWMPNPGVAHLGDDLMALLPVVEKQTSIHNLLGHQIEAHLGKLVNALPADKTAQKALLQSYQATIAGLEKRGGRLSLMLTQSMVGSYKEYIPAVNAELDVILKGGLRRNPGFLRQSLKLLMHLPSQAENYFDPGQIKHLESQVGRYIKLVESRLGSQSLSVANFSKKILTPLAKHNSAWRMYVVGTGFVFSMLGVGLLIPKLQYWMTKYLTGTDVHPGIAAAATKVGSEPVLAHG